MASSRKSPTHRKIKQVVVLGGSYSGQSGEYAMHAAACRLAHSDCQSTGSHAAELLAKTLPNNYRVLLIDRQS